MHIKFLQINVWWGGWLWQNLVDFIKKEDPDIITVQEAYHAKDPDLAPNFRTISEFKKIFNYPYLDFVPEFLDIREGRQIEMGNAIFSKFPITSTDSKYFVGQYQEWGKDQDEAMGSDKIPRRLQHAVLNINNKVVDLFNVHGIVNNRGSYDSPERLHMSELIVKQVKGKPNVILAGDFNVQPNTETIRNVEKHLVNVFKDQLKSSFNMRRKDDPGYATATVDMVFVSKNIKILAQHCPDVDISDHYPLLATLDIMD